MGEQYVNDPNYSSAMRVARSYILLLLNTTMHMTVNTLFGNIISSNGYKLFVVYIHNRMRMYIRPCRHSFQTQRHNIYIFFFLCSALQRAGLCLIQNEL